MKKPHPFPRFPTSNIVHFITVCCIALTMMACGSTPTTQEPPEPDAETISTDIATLTDGMALIALPVEAQWIEYRLGNSTVDIGPSDLALIAVMRFDETDIVQMQEQLTEPRSNISVEPAFVRDWFPVDVKNAFTLNKINGFLEVNVPVYDATPFYSGSYLNGYAFIVGNYVLISMHTT